VAEQLGTPFMPWQRSVMDVALEIENGKFAYNEVIVTVPRQSGKTTSVLALILARALGTGKLWTPPQTIRYTAQTRSDARKKWYEDWLPVLEKSPFAEHYSARLANGDESLLFSNGSRQGLIASTMKSGHGGTVDLGILDEAFAHPDARLEQALKPAMITRNQPPHPGAQLWVISTAGTRAMSPYLWNKVEKGREIVAAGLNRSVAYFEWSADEDADPSDENVWWGCMPALGRTAQIDAVRADFLSMDLHEFMRAYLNMWTTISLDPVIPLAEWNALAIPNLDTEGIPVCLAVDVSPERSSSVAACGVLPDGNFFVEVIAHRKGTDWVPGLVERLVNEHHVSGDVVLDPASPAGSLADDLDRRGVQTHPIKVRELGDACGQFFDAVTQDKTVRHLGQQDLAAALDGGAKRPIGDGAWGWGRKNSGADISPLVACTLAFWAARSGLGGSSELWSLDEIVARLRAERAGLAPAPQQPQAQAQAHEAPTQAEPPWAVRHVPI